MNLVSIELRRMRARRIIVVLFGAAVLGTVISSTIVFFKHADEGPSPRDQLLARAAAFETCMRQPVPPGLGIEPGGPPFEIPPSVREEMCEEGDFAFGEPDKRFYLTKIKDVIGGTTVPLVLAAWILGASFIGAEWRAGTLTTWLTWEPRRARVMISKAIAAAITGASLYVLVQAIIAATLLPSALFRGSTAGAGADWARSTIGLGLRASLLAAFAGVIGFAVGALGRNTAAALGIGFVYLAVLEGGVLGSIFPHIRRWLIVGNSIVFATGERDAGEVFGRSPEQAGLVLSLYAVALIAIAVVSFRARDVT